MHVGRPSGFKRIVSLSSPVCLGRWRSPASHPEEHIILNLVLVGNSGITHKVSGSL